MTILVGVKCSDGLVIGADSMATSAMGFNPLIQMVSNDKIQKIGNHGLVAATGSVGLAQRLKAITDELWTMNPPAHRSGAIKYMSEVSRRMMADMGATGVPKYEQGGVRFGALLGMVINNAPVLFEFGTTDFQPEIKEGRLFAVSIGSGQILADPFLSFVSRVLWDQQEPEVEIAKIGVFWALSHTIAWAPGGVGGEIHLGVIKKTDGQWGAEILDDTQEQAQFVTEIEAGIKPRESVDAAAASDPPRLDKKGK